MKRAECQNNISECSSPRDVNTQTNNHNDTNFVYTGVKSRAIITETRLHSVCCFVLVFLVLMPTTTKSFESIILHQALTGYEFVEYVNAHGSDDANTSLDATKICSRYLRDK